MAIRSEIRHISPSEASRILDEQQIDLAHPATSSPATDSYADEMRSGRWILNGDALIFDEAGQLLDGAKRLVACVRAGRSFATLIVHGVARNSVVTIGTHRRRNYSDTMKILGAGDRAGALSKTLSFVFAIQERKWDKGRRGKQFTRGVMASMARRYPEIRECVEEAMSKADVRLVTPGVYATALFLLSRVDATAAGRFVELTLRRGGEMPTSQPLEMLRRRLEGERTKDRQMVAREVVALILIAWSAWREARTLTKLTFVSGGEKPQAFPTVSGWTPALDISTEDDGGGDLEGLVEDTDIEVTIDRIEPSEALQMLKHMVPNRKVVMSRVAVIVRDLHAGHWQLNGQSVKFDREGRLCDGQHRLSACVQSGIAIETIVVRGLSSSAFSTLDMQETRGFKHYLDTLGQANASHLAAAVRVLWTIERGNVGSSVTPSNTEMEQFWKANPTIRDCGSIWGPLRSVCQPSVAISITALLRNADAGAADVFISKLATGDDLSKNDPILVVRNHLTAVRNLDHKRSQGGYQQIFSSVAMILNAWNAWKAGERVKSAAALGWNPEKSAFPKAA